MCNTCGCNITPGNRPLVLAEKPKKGVTTISVLQNLLSQNNLQAEHNRAHFDAQKVLVINLMSSPGSGKTALLEATIKRLRGSLKIAVIEGDLETENDAKRIQAQGVPAYQITTGTACHLDAHLVQFVEFPAGRVSPPDRRTMERVMRKACFRGAGVPPAVFRHIGGARG